MNSISIWSASAAAGFTILAVYPVYAYLRRGWDIKKTDIFSSFSDEAKILYLKVFQKIDCDGQEEDARAVAREKFEAIYVVRYGRYKFATPLALFTLTNLVAAFLLSESALSWVERSGDCSLAHFCGASVGLPSMVIPSVAAAGIGGAYVWIVADLISRNRRLDLSPSDVLNATLRLAISATLATAVIKIAATEVALPLAFALGAFPLDSVRAMLRRFAEDKIGLKPAADSQSTDTVLSLDSIDHPIADRLFDADISTVAQLAYTDPVQLSMRTGLAFDFVIDIVSQALAWTYLGDRLDDLRPAGLRGAMEINNFVEELAEKNTSVAALAQGLLKIAPTLPQDTTNPPVRRKMETAGFLNACDQIANDPYTKFLVEFWDEGRESGEDAVPDYAALLGIQTGPVPAPAG